jgi:hypothetical protein
VAPSRTHAGQRGAESRCPSRELRHSCRQLHKRCNAEQTALSTWPRFCRGFLQGSGLGLALLACGLLAGGVALILGVDKDASLRGFSLTPLDVLSFGLAGGAFGLLQTERSRWYGYVVASVAAAAIALSACAVMAFMCVSERPISWIGQLRHPVPSACRLSPGSSEKTRRRMQSSFRRRRHMRIPVMRGVPPASSSVAGLTCRIGGRPALVSRTAGGEVRGRPVHPTPAGPVSARPVPAMPGESSRFPASTRAEPRLACNTPAHAQRVPIDAALHRE